MAHYVYQEATYRILFVVKPICKWFVSKVDNSDLVSVDRTSASERRRRKLPRHVTGVLVTLVARIGDLGPQLHVAETSAT